METSYNTFNTYKENWYALAICMCVKKSVAESLTSMGLVSNTDRCQNKGTHSRSKRFARNTFNFDKEEILELYEELGSIRAVAESLGVNNGTLGVYMVNNGIKVSEIKPRLKASATFDKEKIIELCEGGMSVKKISETLNYRYSSLRNYMLDNKIVRGW